MTKRKLRLLKISILIICFFLVLVYLISPVKKNSVTEVSANSSFEQYIKRKSPDSINYNKSSKQIIINYSISESELSDMLFYAISTNNSQNNRAYKIIGTSVDVTPKYIKIYVGIKLYNLIPSQITLQFVPKINNDNIELKLEKSTLGHLPISNKLVLNRIKNIESSELQVDTANQQLLFKINTKNLFKIQGLTLEYGLLKFGAALSFDSNFLNKLPLY